MKSLLVLGALLAAIALYGYLMPRWINQRYYTVTNLGFSLSAVVFAWLTGVSRADLGLNISLSSCLIALAVVLGTFLIVGVIARRHRLRFKRSNYYELGFRIPFGTALSEELIFRSSLMGILLHSYSRFWALGVSSIIFGFWHLLPGPNSIWAQQNLAYNAGPDWLVKASSLSLTVAVTTVGGLFFGWLRLAGGGILLPWIFHTATNSVGWTYDKASRR